MLTGWQNKTKYRVLLELFHSTRYFCLLAQKLRYLSAVADEKHLNHTNFPSCNASKCRILRCFATHAAICEMHRILSKSSLQRKMRQISASKRSQNVVEIAKTDYCGFGRVLSFILSHPSISRHRERPCRA